MCGLLAFFSAYGEAHQHKAALGEALECMHHRGPDETGVEVVGLDAVFAHKRLSIIDVALSHEPLGYDHGRYLLTFNGEIYNYLELRDQLAAEFGAQFATNGDGEVIVAGYHYWGEAILDKLRGMFSFVIWDQQERVAFGARDPFGIKPMHYLETNDGLYLASEKKALLPFADSASRGDAGIDTANLSHYLTLQYVPEPRTLHKGISRIGSGECLTWSPGERVKTRRYYRAVFRPTPTDNPEALYARIRETLRESVRMHMRSDVPVGAFLSSGIDSTAVVALAREFNPNILTFTVGYDVAGYSEIDVAQDSARHLDVTTIPTKIGAQEMMDALPKIVWHLDDPVADPALVPLYFVAKKAAEHVTVVLSGEGADEFFGGYTIYREPLSLSMVNDLPDGLQKGLRAVSKVIPQGVKGKSFLERGTTPIEARYYGNARIFNEAEKQKLLRRYDPSVRYTDVTAPIYAEVPDLDDVTTMQYVDLYTWLRGDILVKADRMSMAHSLELRVPFLDKEVFDVASIVPVDLKLPPRSDATKYAMRQALQTVVPPAIVNRRKLGFPTPTRVWLAGEMYDWARNIFATSGAGELLDLKYADRLLQEHKAGEADHSRKIWTVLVFCIWHAIFVAKTLDPGISRNQSALLTKPVVGSMVS
ncbi:asparagine synthase (glutamine-hydrolyzing) [Allocatelliglobosispora scoriae]|uniref:asparagine synthase (glutamine-hydrolyzing) n=1 Tax=Allocatelliglobosispora scoriae TaxID=643052 RepID=A0A841BZK1_9ACTN|nr:asparagine synthase (glutamine-hydrolyzing) [Allocatelliglobosispora scoriae]MBB5873115.1 asparagine synthase (glutamine-hydrolyzing) [Allocatelliglobosispora scoriae]